MNTVVKGMKMKQHITRIALALAGILLAANIATAQIFMERESAWKTETIRQSGADTVRLVHHSFFTISPLNDTIALMYHEPMPDSVMPKTAIEIGKITIQAESASEVIEQLEKVARRVGADWIVGFNEPRLRYARIDGNITSIYHSEAMLYKVINEELAPESEIANVYCGENHLGSCQAVLTWLDKK